MEMRSLRQQNIFVHIITLLAGAINTISIALHLHSISHMTGNLAHLAININLVDWREIWLLSVIIFSFFLGAAVDGYIFYDRKVRKVQQYLCLFFFIGLIILLVAHYGKNSSWQMSALAFVLGLQNGSFLKIRQIIVRTTHMTGTVTDAAFYLGATVRGAEDAWKNFLFHLISIVYFLFGSYLGYKISIIKGWDSFYYIAIIYLVIIPIVLLFPQGKKVSVKK